VYEDEDDERHPLQAKIDSFVQKVVDYYFTIPEGFITETQSYPDPITNRKKTNIAVATTVGVTFKKALIIEAKRFSRPYHQLKDKWYKTNKSVWKKAKIQIAILY
jgi:hypothetical protein